jgi:FG-GAP-like repeat
MHYPPPSCPQGTAAQIQTLTPLDVQGVRRAYGVPNLYFADMNNDNRADAIAVTESGAWVALSTGSAFGTVQQWATGAASGMLGTHFRDLNNDGRADLILVDPTGISVRRNTSPGSFDAAVDWSEGPFYGARGTFFADLTNDRRAEAIVVNDYGPVSVRRSTGATPFEDVVTWTTATEVGSYGTFFADVTADRRADLLRVDGPNVWVRKSNGSTFGAATAWLATSFSMTACTRGVYFADVSNDLRADFICVTETGITVAKAKNTNDGFNAPASFLSSAFFGNRGTHFADVTGDGRADAIKVDDSGVTVRRAQTTNLSFGAAESWSGPYYGQD